MKAYCKINSTYSKSRHKDNLSKYGNVLILLRTFSNQAKARTIKSCSYGHDAPNKGEMD